MFQTQRRLIKLKRKILSAVFSYAKCPRLVQDALFLSLPYSLQLLLLGVSLVLTLRGKTFNYLNFS